MIFGWKREIRVAAYQQKIKILPQLFFFMLGTFWQPTKEIWLSRLALLLPLPSLPIQTEEPNLLIICKNKFKYGEVGTAQRKQTHFLFRCPRFKSDFWKSYQLKINELSIMRWVCLGSDGGLVDSWICLSQEVLGSTPASSNFFSGETAFINCFSCQRRQKRNGGYK